MNQLKEIKNHIEKLFDEKNTEEFNGYNMAYLDALDDVQDFLNQYKEA